MDTLLTPSETADKLRCSLAQVYSFSSRRILPKYKISSRLFFKASDIERFVEGCRVEARKPVGVVP